MSTRELEKEKRFIALYQAYVDEIYQFVYARSGYHSATAEDISQDIFLDVLKSLDQFKGLCSERTWIYRIARNKLNDYYRKQYKRTIDLCDIEDSLEALDPLQDIDLQMEKTFESHFVRSCLDQLPIHYRITLLMKYADGRSIHQIAEIAGKSPKATESLLQRAKAAFIKEYSVSKEREERIP